MKYNREDFDIEIEKIQPNLFGLILSTVFNKQDALDVLQETNYILCTKQEEYNPDKGSLKVGL